MAERPKPCQSVDPDEDDLISLCRCRDDVCPFRKCVPQWNKIADNEASYRKSLLVSVGEKDGTNQAVSDCNQRSG